MQDGSVWPPARFHTCANSGLLAMVAKCARSRRPMPGQAQHQRLIPLLLLAVAAVVHEHGHALPTLPAQDLGCCLHWLRLSCVQAKAWLSRWLLLAHKCYLLSKIAQE